MSITCVPSIGYVPNSRQTGPLRRYLKARRCSHNNHGTMAWLEIVGNLVPPVFVGVKGHKISPASECPELLVTQNGRSAKGSAQTRDE